MDEKIVTGYPCREKGKRNGSDFIPLGFFFFFYTFCRKTLNEFIGDIRMGVENLSPRKSRSTRINNPVLEPQSGFSARGRHI